METINSELCCNQTDIIHHTSEIMKGPIQMHDNPWPHVWLLENYWSCLAMRLCRTHHALRNSRQLTAIFLDTWTTFYTIEMRWPKTLRKYFFFEFENFDDLQNVGRNIMETILIDNNRIFFSFKTIVLDYFPDKPLLILNFKYLKKTEQKSRHLNQVVMIQNGTNTVKKINLSLLISYLKYFYWTEVRHSSMLQSVCICAKSPFLELTENQFHVQNFWKI